MNHSGDVAEQMVRMSLEGVEVAAKITGTAAKEIAVFLIAALKNKDKNTKLRGRVRLTSMLKSGKALEIFSVKECDLKKFMYGAKQYGIVYCVLRNTTNNPDGICDIMVKADDAPKISRLVERLKFATVDKAKIESEIIRSKTEKSTGAESEISNPDSTEQLLDELMGVSETKTEDENPRKESDSRPLTRGGEMHGADTPPPKHSPSEPIFESRNKSAKATPSKPSVTKELREITAVQKNKAQKSNIKKRKRGLENAKL